MSEKPPRKGTSAARAPRRVRADAQRNLKTLLEAARAVFATAGVDAPVRDIAEKAGVGIGTLYRHFPQRSDLIVAVFRNGVDCCADAATTLAQEYPPVEALTHWMQHYVDFIATKRGLAAALYSGNPAYDSLPAYFEQRLVPALQSLLDAAGAAGKIRRDVDPFDLLKAVAQLCNSAPGGDPEHTGRMVALLIDGLRYGAGKETRPGD